MKLFKKETWSKENIKLYIIRYFFIKFSKFIPPKPYLKALYWLKNGESLNLNKPNTFNEKLNWLKLYNRNPQYSIMADKYLVKEYVKGIVGEEYVVPCYGAWERFEDIDFNNLPKQFVLKANHDSSGATICLDKENFDYTAKTAIFNKLVKRNYYYNLKEWPYKNIKRRILAEEFLSDGTGTELRDYKFYCFNGKPKYMYCTNKGAYIRENFYDMDFKPVNISHGYDRIETPIEKPSGFETMKELAAKLSKEIPFVRVDFFQIGEKVYFGEFTFYDWGGMKPFTEKDFEYKLGELIILPTKQD